MLVKMKSMFAIGFAFTSLLSMFNSIDQRGEARYGFSAVNLPSFTSKKTMGAFSELTP